jgi:hypothetical protein
MSQKQTNTNEVAAINTNMLQLSALVTDAVNMHVEVAPIYKNITDSILKILGSESELSNMETKDLIKLLEVSSKAQIAPIEQLTKLVQSISNLYEQQQTRKKMDELQAVVEQIQEQAGRKIITSDTDIYSTLDSIKEDLDAELED